MGSPVSTVPTALATPADFVERFPMLSEDGSVSPNVIADWLSEATAAIEERTSRRLAPFYGHIYQDRLWGTDPDEYGSENSDLPIDIYGSLGMSEARALGANVLVRHFWLDQYAPFYPELWSYTIESMNLVLTYGNIQPINFDGGGIRGPDVSDGHCWIRLGTFAPPGTRISVVYSGGYTGGIPPSLKRACLFQAAKYAILEAEPQNRKGMNLDELDHQINLCLAPWIRG